MSWGQQQWSPAESESSQGSHLLTLFDRGNIIRGSINEAFPSHSIPGGPNQPINRVLPGTNKIQAGRINLESYRA